MPPKKQKEQVLSLEDFASSTGSGAGSGSWADEEADFTPAFQTSSALPTGGAKAASFGPWVSGGAAPGAGQGTFTFGGAGGAPGARGPAAPIPDAPPYTARVGNVSYDVTEQIIQDFFAKDHQLAVESVRSPREADGRVRGSAFVDFATRDGLVAASKLGGSQILGRTVSINTVDQRGGAGGGFGGQSFDWTRRAPVGPTDGAGAGAQGDRFDRFRPKNTRADEPSSNWGERQGPTDGSGSRSGAREPREPREPAAPVDWSARAGPTTGAASFRGARSERSGHSDRDAERESASFDWSRRAGPTTGAASSASSSSSRDALGARSGERRERREQQPEPAFDWSKRAEHTGGSGARPHHRREQAPQPALDWGKRAAPSAGHAGPGTPSNVRGGAAKSDATSALAPAPATQPAQKTVDPKISRSQRGFNALQIDDDDEEEDNAQGAKQPPAQVQSIGEIQQAQRETSNEGWCRV